MTELVSTRPLTENEHALALWMLQNGAPEAAHFTAQLARAEATLWRCVCGCASFNFKITGEREAPPGVHILGDYIVGSDKDCFGIFIFESDGVLSGVEVYSLAVDAPSELPQPSQLRPANFDKPRPESQARNDA